VVRNNSIGGISLTWRTRVLFGAACDRFSIGFRVIEELSFTSRARENLVCHQSIMGPLRRGRSGGSFRAAPSQASQREPATV
jgi:hypothetical protein